MRIANVINAPTNTGDMSKSLSRKVKDTLAGTFSRERLPGFLGEEFGYLRFRLLLISSSFCRRCDDLLK
jgi:hypothetical protein